MGDASLEDEPIKGFAPAAVGHYSDEFQRTAGGWRFAHRELHLAFENWSYFQPDKLIAYNDSYMLTK